MPIHDQSYRRYTGDRAPKGRAWTVIARSGIKAMFSKRAFLWLVIIAWLPFVIRTVQIYIAANYPNMPIVSVDAKLFRQFLEQQGVFVFFITIFTGAGLIANDMRANALQIYLSKPLDRIEYVAGKFAVLAFFLLLTTWLPAMMLVVMQIAFSGSFTFISSNFYVLPAIFVYCGIETGVLALIVLALSSLSKSARFVGIMYAGVFFFSQALFGVLAGVTHDTGYAWISVPTCLMHIGDVIFRLPGRFNTSGVAVSIALAVMAGVAAFILERRVRGVEVVT